MPAHVTLIYPFLSPKEIDERVLETLRALFASREQFKVQFGGIAGFPGVVYLVPEPAELIIELVNELVEVYPQVPPYGGMFPSVVPHLTLAETADPEVQDRFIDLVAGLLPIEISAREVWLMVRRRGRWNAAARFALARSTASAFRDRDLRQAPAS